MTSVSPDSPPAELHQAARLLTLTMQGAGDEAALMLELVPEEELRALLRYVLATAALTVEAVCGGLPTLEHLREMLHEFREHR